MQIPGQFGLGALWPPRDQPTPAKLEIDTLSSHSRGQIAPGSVAGIRLPRRGKRPIDRPAPGYSARRLHPVNLPVAQSTGQNPVCNERQACGDDARGREES